MFRLSLLILGALMLAACGQKTLSDEEYAKQSSALANEFLAVGQQIQSAPMPDVKHLPRNQRLKTIGEKIKADAAKFQPVANRIRELRPPKKWEEHRQVLLDTVEGTSRYMSQWGDAVITGSKDKEAAAGEALDTHLLTSMDRLIKVTGEMGADTAQLRRMRDSLKDQLDKL